jgi:CyaY protein
MGAPPALRPPPLASALSDHEFHERSGHLLAAVEAQVDTWLQDDVIDIDSQRSGGLLRLRFAGGTEIVLNTQPPLHELWLAAKGGGFHFRFDGTQWRDTRDGRELLAVLSEHASLQGGQALRFSA